jgi:hypothetical protein
LEGRGKVAEGREKGGERRQEEKGEGRGKEGRGEKKDEKGGERTKLTSNFRLASPDLFPTSREKNMSENRLPKLPY